MRKSKPTYGVTDILLWWAACTSRTICVQAKRVCSMNESTPTCPELRTFLFRIRCSSTTLPWRGSICYSKDMAILILKRVCSISPKTTRSKCGAIRISPGPSLKNLRGMFREPKGIWSSVLSGSLRIIPTVLDVCLWGKLFMMPHHPSARLSISFGKFVKLIFYKFLKNWSVWISSAKDKLEYC